MPDELGVLPEHVLRRVVRVVIAVGAGKDDDGKFDHASSRSQSPAVQRQLSVRRLLHFDPIALDHRVREHLVGDFRRERARLLRRRRLQVELEELP